MPRIVSKPYEIIQAYGSDPKYLCGIKLMLGGFFYCLTKKFGGKVPDGLFCGKTFKLQHKKVVLFDKEFVFPFDLDEFEQAYQERLT